MRDAVRAASVALAVLFAVSGCTKVGDAGAAGSATSGGNAWTHPGEFTFAENQDMKSLNPMLSSSVPTGDVGNFIYSYAVRYDDKARPVADALKEVPTLENGDVSKDGLTLLYKLRPNIYWHDGVKMTCGDLAFTWKAVMNPANNDITHDGYRDIERIDCSNPLVAVVHMKRVYAPFLQQLWGVSGNAPIMPAHILAKYNDAKGSFNTAPYQSAPIGSGPFSFVRWDRGQDVQLTAFDHFFLGKPKLRRVTFRIVPDDSTLVAQLKTHEIDMAIHIGANVMPEATNIAGMVSTAPPLFLYDHIDFNLKRPLFADVRLRRALEMGVDRKAVAEKIAHGYADVSGVPQSPKISPDYDPNVPFVPYDFAKARSTLDALGWKPGPDGVRVKNGERLAFSYATQTESVTGRAIEALVQREWDDLGADVSVKNQPTAQFFDNSTNGVLQGGKYDVAGFAWSGSADPDDSAIYGGKNMAPTGQNAIFWNDPAANQAMEDGLGTVDPAKRKAASFVEQERFGADVPSIILFFRRDGIVYNSDLKGFTASPVISAFWNPQEYSI